MSYSVVCLEEVTQNNRGTAFCSSGWQIVESVPSFDFSMLSAEQLGGMWMAGFLATLIPLMACKGAAYLIETIRNT